MKLLGQAILDRMRKTNNQSSQGGLTPYQNVDVDNFSNFSKKKIKVGKIRTMLDTEIDVQMKKHSVDHNHMEKIRLLLNQEIVKMMKKRR